MPMVLAHFRPLFTKKQTIFVQDRPAFHTLLPLPEQTSTAGNFAGNRLNSNPTERLGVVPRCNTFRMHQFADSSRHEPFSCSRIVHT